MERLLRLLAAIHPLSEELTAYLQQHVESRVLKRKEFLLKAGHVCRSIYFIEYGLLRCFYLQGSADVSSWFMKEGDVICAVESFFDQTASFESIQALESTEVYSISFSQLQHIYQYFPEFNFVGRKLVEHYYKLAEQRLYSLRMQRGLERFEWLTTHHRDLIQRVEQKYLASYLGITEQYLSMLRAGKKLGRLRSSNS